MLTVPRPAFRGNGDLPALRDADGPIRVRLPAVGGTELELPLPDGGRLEIELFGSGVPEATSPPPPPPTPPPLFSPEPPDKTLQSPPCCLVVLSVLLASRPDALQTAEIEQRMQRLTDFPEFATSTIEKALADLVRLRLLRNERGRGYYPAVGTP